MAKELSKEQSSKINGLVNAGKKINNDFGMHQGFIRGGAGFTGKELNKAKEMAQIELRDLTKKADDTNKLLKLSKALNSVLKTVK